MCLTDSPVENCVAHEVFSNLQAEQGVTGTQAVHKETAGPWEGVGKCFNFIHPVNVIQVETTDQGMLFIRYRGQ